MSRWARLDVELWFGIASHLPKPWPQEAAIADLRVIFARDGEAPTRSALVDRWGWSDWKVRALVTDAGRWMDAHQRLQRSSSAPPGNRG